MKIEKDADVFVDMLNEVQDIVDGFLGLKDDNLRKEYLTAFQNVINRLENESWLVTDEDILEKMDVGHPYFYDRDKQIRSGAGCLEPMTDKQKDYLISLFNRRPNEKRFLMNEVGRPLEEFTKGDAMFCINFMNDP